MEPFNLEAFMKEPTLWVVNLLKKSQLIEVANHYELEVNGSKKKGEIKRLLIDHLIDEEIIPEDEVDITSIQGTDENMLELRRLELQDREKERDSQLRLKSARRDYQYS